MATKNSIVFSQRNLFSSAFIAFYDMKKTEVLSDVTIRIENRVISAHRVILAAVIPYFRTMFTSNLAECKMKEITMKEMDSDALENIIDFAYTNQINITTENVEALLVASEFLQLIQIRDSCCDFLSKMLDTNNVMRIRSLADSLNCSNLVKNSDCYIRQHFDSFCLTKDFISLPFPFINELIRRDDVHVKSEEKVFEAVMTWVKTDTSRNSALPTLLTGIRLTQLTPQFLMKKASREELILKSFPCRNLLDEAKYFHILPEERPPGYSFSLKKRCYSSASQDSMYLFCCSWYTGLIIQKYIAMTGKWNTLLNDKSRRDVQRVIALGDEIYVFRETNFEIFNPSTLKWTPRTKFPGTISQLKYAVPCCNMIYCFTSTTDYSNAVYFDPKKNNWLRHQQSIQFFDAGLVSSGEDIYIFGMHIKGVFDISMANRRYNPQTGIVTLIPQMNSPDRISFSYAVMDGKIYLCGGTDDLQSEPLRRAEVYEISDRHWRSISSMNTERKEFSLVSYDKKLYAFGGKGRNEANIKSIECYDPVTDKWTPAGSFNGEYSFVEAVVIPSQSQ